MVTLSGYSSTWCVLQINVLNLTFRLELLKSASKSNSSGDRRRECHLKRLRRQLYVNHSITSAERWPEATLDEAAATRDPIVKTDCQVKQFKHLCIHLLRASNESAITLECGMLHSNGARFIQIAFHLYKTFLTILIKGNGDRLRRQCLKKFKITIVTGIMHFYEVAYYVQYCKPISESILSREISIILKNNNFLIYRSRVYLKSLHNSHLLSWSTLSMLTNSDQCAEGIQYIPLTTEKGIEENILKACKEPVSGSYDDNYTFTGRHPSGDTFLAHPVPLLSNLYPQLTIS